MNLTITAIAQDKIREFIKGDILENVDKVSDSTSQALRVAVIGGGCAGFQYSMNLDSKTVEDKVFTYDGFEVVVDPQSVLYLDGVVIDYAVNNLGGGFQIKNPNSKGGCGCGSSFQA
jgi:iron-sulfur cluster assembly accessory protein